MPDDNTSAVITVDNSLAEATLNSFFRRHWSTFFFCFGLLVHICCLVVLQKTETNSEVPPKGADRTMQQIAGYVMYVNVVLMSLAVVLDSHLYITRQCKNSPLNKREEDYDLETTAEEAKAELRFISVFFRRHWRPVIEIAGCIANVTLSISSSILMLSVLVNVIALFLPSSAVPVQANHAMLFSLAIPGLICLLAALLLVLHWVYCKYHRARQTVSRIMKSGGLHARDDEVQKLVDEAGLVDAE